MTKYANKIIKKRPISHSLPTGTQMIWSFVCIFSLALIIRNSDVAIRYMSEGLYLCVRTVIPSLFPFMVISDLIVSSGTASLAGRLIKRPVKLLFGIGEDGGCAILLGVLCGFPIGAKSAVALYDRGKLTRGELERILTFSNIPSSAFVLSAVGISLFGDESFGKALYVITIISAIIAGIAQNVTLKLKSKKEVPAKEYFYGASTIPSTSKSSSFADIFTSAVGSSAIGMLKICAFVVFFGAFVGTLGMASEGAALPQQIRAILFSLFELTGGMSQASAVASHYQGAVIAAFAAGWSGLSVHFQIMSLCSGRNISFKPYIISKLAQGLLSATLMGIYLL